jgi:hypothetical protein
MDNHDTTIDGPAAQTEPKGRAKRASLAVFADFWLEAQSPTPLWQQLYQQLREAVISRRLPP